MEVSKNEVRVKCYKCQHMLHFIRKGECAMSEWETIAIGKESYVGGLRPLKPIDGWCPKYKYAKGWFIDRMFSKVDKLMFVLALISLISTLGMFLAKILK